MKKNIIILFVLFLFLSSCRDNYISEKAPPEIDFDIYTANGLNINAEKEYNNFSVTCEGTVFSKTTEKIKFYLTNNNPGNGFYFYNTPFVEKKVKDKWISVDYDSSSKHFARYGFCGNENDSETCFGTVIYLFPEFISDPDFGGLYRALLYTAKNVYYCEFYIE
ncbi:MAG: hypothetical protein IKS28_03790 [Clostridia bacterium]|jgi:hypothetical protein|nr:hypothetical protein [Clostridia bacterium]